MSTDGMQQAEDQGFAVRSSWYVALAQLPGLPVKLRLEVIAIVSAAVKRMPVFARRDHFWATGAHASAYAGEDNEALDDPVPEVATQSPGVAFREASGASPCCSRAAGGQLQLTE